MACQKGTRPLCRKPTGTGRSPTLEAVRTRQPVLRRDVRRFLLAEPLYAPIHRFAREVSWDTVYIVPLVYKGRALGAINLRYLLEQEPGEDEKVFLKAVADQTAVTVENARLLRVDHSLVARLPDHMRH
jgi:GAF domain-containing protein